MKWENQSTQGKLYSIATVSTINPSSSQHDFALMFKEGCHIFNTFTYLREDFIMATAITMDNEKWKQ
jgi:hypothetical protein